MRRNTPVSWLLAVCFAVLVMGEAEQREEGELEDEGEDEYYGSDFWGEGQARAVARTARASDVASRTPRGRRRIKVSTWSDLAKPPTPILSHQSRCACTKPLRGRRALQRVLIAGCPWRDRQTVAHGPYA